MILVVLGDVCKLEDMVDLRVPSQLVIPAPRFEKSAEYGRTDTNDMQHVHSKTVHKVKDSASSRNMLKRRTDVPV